MADLRMSRFNYGPDLPSKVAGTFSRLILPSSRQLFTVERSWLGNKPFVSCIPPGVYTLRKRFSRVVKDTTNGEFTRGWEVTNVPGRSYIMWHPANWPHNLEGCIGPGLDYGLLADAQGTYRLAVKSSLDAFRVFMGELEGEDEHRLIIMPYTEEYP